MANIENDAIKTIANEILKAAKAISEENSKRQMNNLANFFINAPANAQTGSELATRLVGTLTHLSNVSIDHATIKAAQIRDLEAEVATIAEAKIRDAHIERAQIDDLFAPTAEFIRASAQAADIEFGDIRDLVASAMVLTEGAMGSVYIDNLAVTNASFVSATLGELVLKSIDGKYYEIMVQPDGTIITEEVTVTPEEIAAGETESGRGIVETTANIEELNAENIKAQSIIVNEILAAALTVGKITATEAFISSAIVPELYTTAIGAIGEALTLNGSSVIINVGEDTTQDVASLLADLQNDVGDANDAAQRSSADLTAFKGENENVLNGSKAFFLFDSDGSGNPRLTIGSEESKFKLVITNEKMSFTEDGEEIAYMSNNKLWIANAEILTSLKYGSGTSRVITVCNDFGTGYIWSTAEDN